MEAFSLLKYWRGGAGLRLLSSSTTTTTTTILTAADDDYDAAGDDGPFFDIEFTLPDNHHKQEEEEEEEEESKLVQDDEDPNMSLSPSHEFKLLHVVQDDEYPSSLQPNPTPHHFNSSFFKSTTKFRVFMSSLKKSKSASSSKDEHISTKPLFTGDNNNKKDSSPEEKQRFSKEAMQKYLKMVKPLYVKVSRRYGDKLSLSGHFNEKSAPLKEDSSSSSSNNTNNKSQKVTTGLRVVCKHLGKSRSASAAVAAAPPILSSSKRRDDSLLQQQDGIQGAILHCKTSFNASIRNKSEIPRQLPRCVSEPLHEK
ncbi:hypothetical protein Lal_00007340 [Lupinus albus]|uniref:Uncharacterized protein n=1 Tax=Lupinus albus TaxID=3870 RepID=A0A6A5MKB4_LUPAL|nr:hypothetical protein Lalb_Chr16g0377001 [Lupinus albus]KAF1874726.1 hypothetical protein Lal_00007340 [Lupinus albus]